MKMPSKSLLLAAALAACVVSQHGTDAANSIKIENMEQQNHTYEWEELNHYELLYLTSLSHQNDTTAMHVEFLPNLVGKGGPGYRCSCVEL